MTAGITHLSSKRRVVDRTIWRSELRQLRQGGAKRRTVESTSARKAGAAHRMRFPDQMIDRWQNRPEPAPGEGVVS
jgi:hypothetical protein